MDDATITLLILAGVIVVFVWNRLPLEIVAVGTALTLYATGVLSISESLAGFGDPVVIFIAALFVVSEGIDSTGVTTWAGQIVVARAGESRTRLVVLVMLMSALLTSLITLNGAVAALLPMVVVVAMRVGVPTSQMAMPLAFAGSAGSLLALTGTPVNIIVSDASVAAGDEAFGFFEFALVGVPLVAGTVLIIVLLGPRVLPRRVARTVPPDLSGHARTLVQEYELDGGLYRLRVRERSPLVGSPAAAVDLTDYPGLTLISVQAPGAAGSVTTSVDVDDVIVVSGDADSVSRLVVDEVLAVVRRPTPGEDALLTRELGVAEVVVPPRSPLIGQTVFPGMLRRDDQVILAVQRMGHDRGPRETVLAVGDTMLLQGTWDALDENVVDRDILVVDSPDLVRRRAVPLGPRAKVAIAVLLGMVLLLAFDVVPPVVAGLLAAGAMVLTRVVGVEQAYRSISWTVVVLIGGLIPLSTAITTTGAADEIADVLIDVVGGSSPYLLLLGLFVVTGAMGQIISNTATALIMVPVAVAAATELGVSSRPVLMLMTIAAAASFLTPIATPANMMIMGPGDYRFGDYWKLGLPVMAWFLVVGVLLTPVIWPF